MTSSTMLEAATDPFVAYSRALYEYTFRLWKESKEAEQETLQHRSERSEESDGGKEDIVRRGGKAHST